jgi:hypothetical protein
VRSTLRAVANEVGAPASGVVIVSRYSGVKEHEVVLEAVDRVGRQWGEGDQLVYARESTEAVTSLDHLPRLFW